MKRPPELPAWLEGKPVTSWVLALLIAVYATVFVSTAWVGDDAYITFRTVDNFLGGHGLTWNTDERVQAYTHPLWMLVIAAVCATGVDPYFASLLLSAVCSVLAK